MREWQRREAQNKWWRDMLDKTNDPPLTIDVRKPRDPSLMVWLGIFLLGFWCGLLSRACV